MRGNGKLPRNFSPRALVEKTLRQAEAGPSDLHTPGLLFKAADVARGAGDYPKAVLLRESVWRRYPQHAKAPMALFLQGFTFDSELRDVNMARKYYRQLLDTYPADPLAAQATRLLEVLDTPPEDLVKKFPRQR